MKKQFNQICHNLLFVHISRTWDGKNENSTKSHDANIVLFNCLRVRPMWRSFDNDNLYLNLYIGTITKTGHHQILSMTVYPKFTVQTNLGVRKLWKRTINYFTIKKLKREIQDLEETCYNICSDEMCGCPGDFAESYDRQINSLEYQLWQLTH